MFEYNFLFKVVCNKNWVSYKRLLYSKISIKVMLYNKYYKYNLRLIMNNVYMYVIILWKNKREL